jgi:23S rRNA G2445 N2-methylase RlmL
VKPELDLIATATFGLESVVARELSALGYESRVVRPGWLGFRGGESSVARANLWLRASDRVLLDVAGFAATDFEVLFEQTRTVPWEEILPADARIPVRGRSVKSRLASVPACQSIVKKAIVERLKSAHRLSELAESGPVFPVEVALRSDEARLVLDTTGAGLHKRGYRLDAGAAPLKETLAAGLVLLSRWNADRPFLDPFCGTGTLAIEAALIGRNRAPGLDRSFVSESWPSLSSDSWSRAREEARDLERPSGAAAIEAFDRDESVLRLARRSAERASVASEIRFARRDFSEVASERSHGVLITNPPYGGRSGDAEETRALYREMPSIFRRLPSWSFFVLTARRDFERLVGQEADRRRKLFNGDIECTLYQFFGPPPGGAEEARQAFGGLDQKAGAQAQVFANRLRKRSHHLRKWPKKRSTDCYRLYERDVKEVPLVLDRYGDSLLLIPSRDRLLSRTRAEHEDWLDLMARTAGETLGVAAEKVHIHGRRQETERSVDVREEGLTFEARLGTGAPGIVPGDRELRRWIRKEAPERRVLVLHCGADPFGVAAAAGGARSTTSVDADRSVRGFRDWSERNFRLNGLEGISRRFVRAEVEDFLEGDRGTYDLAIVLAPDPEGPAFEVALPEGLPERMVPSGIVLVRSGSARAKLGDDAREHWTVEDVTAESVPEEFRSRKIHRVWRLSSGRR